MAHVTRIKAHDSAKSKDSKPTPVEKTEKIKLVSKKEKKVKKQDKAKDDGKKPFILLRPFVAFGRYLRDSWRELRQVRWPNRKVTWKMVLAVFVYTALFVTFLVVVDLLFDWLFNIILK
ncbi:preprotein translocase subunit SecE [Candidatus Saccharibacteria bacterium]|nr:preprotein translocase subunit SecE [Candidatus Saccharibacteria bacterium]